jgi:hypothetical protein
MRYSLIKVSSFLICFFFTTLVNAGTLNYKTYYAGSYAPTLEFPFYDSVAGYNTDGSNSNPYGLGTTVLSSGTISSPSGYYWGSGQVLDSGRSDYVAVEITGYITWPGTTGEETTVYFGVAADDGVFMNIDGTNVIEDWEQQGTATWNATGSLTKTAGTQYPITIWMYEYGGGAALDVNYCMTASYATSCQADMPTSWFSTTQVTPTITPTSGQTTTINTAKSTTGNGVKMNVDGDNNTINIEQTGEDNFIIGTDWSSDATVTGNNNTLNIDQGNVTSSGNSGNNGIALDITGSTNTLNISQGDYGTDVGDHRMWIDIDGSTNTMTLQQRNDGTTSSEHFMSLDLDSGQNVITMQQLNDGDKILFLDINNNNNTVDVNQSGTGEHYLDISLDTGSYAHDVDISQTGSGDHAARVQLDGYSTDFDLLQQGSIDQEYNVDMTCGVQAGCTLSTTQGN